MASEITTIVQLSVNNGTLLIPLVGTSVQVDQTTARGGGPGTVDVSTSEAAIDFGDIVPGYVYVRNQDATNYVEIGPEDSGALVPMLKLEAGEQALFRVMSGVTIRARVDQTAYGGTTCKVLFLALND